MKAELLLPPELVEQIADRVIEKLKPLFANSKKQEVDTIFTPESLAEYLGVDISWVYHKVSSKVIPYFKVGKYVRFKKADIDEWTKLQSVRPIPSKGFFTERR